MQEIQEQAEDNKYTFIRVHKKDVTLKKGSVFNNLQRKFQMLTKQKNGII